LDQSWAPNWNYIYSRMLKYTIHCSLYREQLGPAPLIRLIALIGNIPVNRVLRYGSIRRIPVNRDIRYGSIQNIRIIWFTNYGSGTFLIVRGTRFDSLQAYISFKQTDWCIFLVNRCYESVKRTSKMHSLNASCALNLIYTLWLI